MAIKELSGGKSEEEDKRLESRQVKKPAEPKPTTVPDTPKDLSMEIDDSELAGNPEIGGDVEIAVDLEDTSDFYKEVNDASMDDHVALEEDHEMIALMDVLQTLGVEPDEANRFSSRIMRISNQPINPTFVEAYGCGNIVNAANHVLRNLNVTGLAAFDLRTAKMVTSGISQRNRIGRKH